eukprot:733946_1
MDNLCRAIRHRRLRTTSAMNSARIDGSNVSLVGLGHTLEYKILMVEPNQGAKVKLTVQELTYQMWSSRNFLSNVKSEDGKYLTASCAYRGPMATQEVDDEVAKIQQKIADDFVTWITNNIKSSIIIDPPEGCSMSGTFVANTTAIKGLFQRISEQFAKMYKRKAFLHWY